MAGENEDSIAEQLDKMLEEGPAKDIFRAEEALGITNAIGAQADAINASDFRPALVAMQAYSIEQFILAINRLFDRPQRYRLRSLPAVAEFALEHVGQLPLQQPWHDPTLERLGVSLQDLAKLEGVEATAFVIRALREAMPTPESHYGLKGLKATRDKQLAHPEHVEAETLPRATWEQAEALLSLAKEMTGTLSACTNTGYVDNDGDYLGTYDSEMTIVNLRRMLRRLGIGRE